MPYPWNAALLPEGVLLGLAMALAGACVGGWIGARLSERPHGRRCVRRRCSPRR